MLSLSMLLAAELPSGTDDVTGLWCLSTVFESGPQYVYFGLAEKKTVSDDWGLPQSSPGDDDRLAIENGTEWYSTLVLSQKGTAPFVRSWNVCVSSQKGASATQELSFRLAKGELPPGALLRFVKPAIEEVLFTWDAATPADAVLTCTVPVGTYRLEAVFRASCKEMSVPIALSPGWNLVANPLATLKSASLGDNTSLLDAPQRTFHPGRQYAQLRSLEDWQSGEALWVYAESKTTLTLIGEMPEGTASTLGDGTPTSSWYFAGLTAALDKDSGEPLPATDNLPTGARAWDPAANIFTATTGLPVAGKGYLLKR